jgi:hypothetical protein
MVSRRTRRRSLIQAASAAALGALLPGREAEARALSPEDIEHLDHGELVRVPLDFEIRGADYFGGISYGVIHAPLERVMAALLDSQAYTSLLPMTLEARVLGRQGIDLRLYLRQGKRVANAEYVLLVRRESPGLLRFWLDPDEPHDVGDLFGYFRVQPWGKDATLLTYAALLHLELGMVKMLFSETIRRYALGTPGLVRAYVQGHGS